MSGRVESNIIPTHSKGKIPKALSYPMGAEAISRGLVGAPHSGELKLYFLSEPVYPGSEFRRYLREKLAYRVFVAEYQHSFSPGYIGMQYLVDRGFYKAKWELRVYPVLREFRFTVNQLLCEQGLPKVADWLRASEALGWKNRGHSITFVFAPTDNSLSISYNDGV